MEVVASGADKIGSGEYMFHGFSRFPHLLGRFRSAFAREGRGERLEVSQDRIAISPPQESERAERLHTAERSLGAQFG